jgi:hypothetical protein
MTLDMKELNLEIKQGNPYTLYQFFKPMSLGEELDTK